MTRREALIAIRDLVERGEWVGDWSYLNDAGIAHQSHGRYFSGWAYHAFRGDLNAGIALLNHVLPGWAVENWTIWPGIPSTVRIVGTHEGEDGTRWHNFKDGWAQAESDTPARALLLAILEALIAKEGKG